MLLTDNAACFTQVTYIAVDCRGSLLDSADSNREMIFEHLGHDGRNKLRNKLRNTTHIFILKT